MTYQLPTELLIKQVASIINPDAYELNDHDQAGPSERDDWAKYSPGYRKEAEHKAWLILTLLKR